MMKANALPASDPTVVAWSWGNVNGAVGMIFNPAVRVWHLWMSFYTSAHADQFGNAFLHGGRFRESTEARAAVEAIGGVLERITRTGGTPAQIAQELARTINDFLGSHRQPPALLPAALQQQIRDTVERHRDLNVFAQQIAQTASQQAGGTPICWSVRLGPPNGVEMVFREEPRAELN